MLRFALPSLDRQVGMGIFLNAGLALALLWPRHQLPIASFYSEWIAALACLVVLGVYVSGSASAVRTWVIPRALLIPVSLAGIVVLQLALGYYAYSTNAWIVLAYLLLAAVAMLLARNLADKTGIQQSLTMILPGLIVAGFLNFIVAMLQKAGLAQAYPAILVPLEQATTHGAYGNLAQQNHFASLQALSAIAWIYWSARQKLPGSIRLVLTLCFIAGLISSGARSAWLYLLVIVGYAYLGTGYVQQMGARKKNSYLLIALLLLLIGLICVPSAYWQRYLYLQETLGARGFLWQAALTISLKYPVLGVGFEGFAYHLIKRLPETGQEVRWGIDQYPHNLILQLAANAGLPMLALFIWQLWRFAGQAVLQWHRPGRLAVLAMLSVLALHSLFEQALVYLYFLIPCAFLFGLSDKNWGSLRLAHRPYGRAAGFCFALVALLAAGKLQRDYAQIEMLLQRPEELQELAQNSYRDDWSLIREWHQFHAYPGMLEAIHPQAIVPGNTRIEAQLELNQRLLRYAPVVEVIYRHAALYAQLGQQQQAQFWLTSAMLAYPADVPAFAQRFSHLCERGANWYCAMAKQIDESQQKKSMPE